MPYKYFLAEKIILLLLSLSLHECHEFAGEKGEVKGAGPTTMSFARLSASCSTFSQYLLSSLPTVVRRDAISMSESEPTM